MSTQVYTPLGIGVGSRIANRYEIIKRLGAGAMSVVYIVCDLSLNREKTALKLLAPTMTGDDSLIERFRNEVLLTRKLTHSNIVRTHEFGATPEGQLYITMEVVDGFSLEQMLQYTEGGLAVGECVYCLYNICLGVAYAHENGVLHRDIKPGNILISRDGKVKITDFGFARMIEPDFRLTRAGDCVGTPLYMAPEQVTEGQLGPRTDIYSIGVMAYELLTGQLPYTGKTWFELAEKILKEPVPDIGKVKKGIPPWLQSFVKKAIAKKAKDRFSCVEEMIEILHPHVDHNKTLHAKTGIMVLHKSAHARKKKKRVNSLSSLMLSINWSVWLPRFMFAALAIVFVMAVGEMSTGKAPTSTDGAKSVSSVDNLMKFIDEKGAAIGSFSDNLQRANEMIQRTAETGGNFQVNNPEYQEFLKYKKEKKAVSETKQEPKIDEGLNSDELEDLEINFSDL